jgi:hypothetical protein
MVAKTVAAVRAVTATAAATAEHDQRAAQGRTGASQRSGTVSRGTGPDWARAGAMPAEMQSGGSVPLPTG